LNLREVRFFLSGQALSRIYTPTHIQHFAKKSGLNLLWLRDWGYFRHHAAKKVVDFNPIKQNRAQGVTFSFYELRITRTELIKGYEENAQRIEQCLKSVDLLGKGRTFPSGQ
jgi:hypothetical protein